MDKCLTNEIFLIWVGYKTKKGFICNDDWINKYMM